MSYLQAACLKMAHPQAKAGAAMRSHQMTSPILTKANSTHQVATLTRLGGCWQRS